MAAFRRPDVLVLAIVGLVAFLALLVAFWPYTVDDTFIFLRYARNLADGHGLTWNPGLPPVEGYTSFSWTVLLALPFVVGVDALSFAKVTGALFMLGAALACARLTLRLAPATPTAPLAATVAAFVFLATPATSVHAVAGMETALATFLVAAWGALLLEAPRQPKATWALAVVGLLLGLTRPEANLFVAVGLGVRLVQVERGPRVALVRAVMLGHVLPGAAYFAWRLARYGHLVPLPFYVKTTANEVAPLAGWNPCLELLRDFSVERPWLLVGLVIAAVTTPAARSLLVAAAAWWVFFVFPEHQMGFDLRYLTPLIPLLLAVALAGLVPVFERLPQQGRGAVVVALAIVLTLATAYSHLGGNVREKRDYGRGGEAAHLPIGRWLASIRARVERPVVATLDSGAIAYFSGWTVIDTWGLNDPEIALAASGKGRDADAILARDPAVVIVISQHGDRFVPHFDFEGPLHERALAKGFRLVSTWAFLPDYHLWVLASPRVPQDVR